MVEKVITYKVGDKIFPTEEDAERYETSMALVDIFERDGYQQFKTVIGRLAESKDLWEAMTAYCEALEHVHNPPPKLNWRLFEEGEVSGSFDEQSPAYENAYFNEPD